MDGQPDNGQGRGPTAWERERPVHQAAPRLVGSEALLNAAPGSLEATGIQPAQASHLWSEEGNRRL